MAFIKITAIGNVGQQPTINPLPSGDLVANFSLAATEKWKDKQSGEQRERTEWIRVSVFGGLVNVVQNYVGQGSKLYVEGDLRTSKYMKDGVEVTGVELRAEKIELLGEPKGQQAGAQNNQGYQQHASHQNAGYQNGNGRQQAPQQNGGYQQGNGRQQAPKQNNAYQRQPQQGYQRGNGRQQAPQQPAYQQNGQYGEFENQ